MDRETSEMATPEVLKKNWAGRRVTSTLGYVVAAGFPEILYEDDEGKLFTPCELLTGKNPSMVIYAGGIPDTPARPKVVVMERIQKASEFAGWDAEVVWDDPSDSREVVSLGDDGELTTIAAPYFPDPQIVGSDVDFVLLAVEAKLGGSFRIVRWDTVGARYWLNPINPSSAAVYLTSQDGALTVGGPWQTYVKEVFDGDSADDRRRGAINLILAIASFGILRLSSPIVIGPGKTVIPRSDNERKALRDRYRVRVSREWYPW